MVHRTAANLTITGRHPPRLQLGRSVKTLTEPAAVAETCALALIEGHKVEEVEGPPNPSS
jgi:hypothetical protein